MDGGLLYRLTIDLVLPPGIVIAVLVFGLAAFRRWPRTSRAAMAGATICLYLLSTPLVSDRLVQLTGDFRPFEPADRGQAGAIVVLAAEKSAAPEYGGVSVGPFTLARVRLGARIARQTGLPLLLSGGTVRAQDAASIAALMQRTLHDEFQTPARWLEEKSHDTRENAIDSARILHGEHIDTIVLVTHFTHMRRAVALFEAQGLHVVPAPTAFPERNATVLLGDFPPSVSSLESSALALHELIAQAASRIDPARSAAAQPVP